MERLQSLLSYNRYQFLSSDPTHFKTMFLFFSFFFGTSITSLLRHSSHLQIVQAENHLVRSSRLKLEAVAEKNKKSGCCKLGGLQKNIAWGVSKELKSKSYQNQIYHLSQPRKRKISKPKLFI